MLEYQLTIYDEEKISWSIWPWKDIGTQGIVYTPPDSPWIKLLQEWLEMKQKLGLDHRVSRPQPEVVTLFQHIEEWIDRNSPAAKYTYPMTWGTHRHVMRGVTETFLSDSLQGEFCGYFDGKTDTELEELLSSFGLEEEGGVGGEKGGWAVQRGYLTALLRQHSGGASAEVKREKEVGDRM